MTSRARCSECRIPEATSPLWTDDGIYWVPATTDPGADPEKHLSHIYDNRARIDTRVKLLQTGHR